jgi:hypothetical protein
MHGRKRIDKSDMPFLSCVVLLRRANTFLRLVPGDKARPQLTQGARIRSRSKFVVQLMASVDSAMGAEDT